MKIRTKLIGMFLVVSLLPLLVTGIIVSINVDRQTVEGFRGEIEGQVTLVDRTINQYFESVKENVLMLASNPKLLLGDNTVTSYIDSQGDSDGLMSMTPRDNGGIEAEIFDIFDQFGKSHPMSAYVYMGLNHGGFIQWPITKVTAGFDPCKRPWYKAALKTPDRVVRTDAYQDASSSTVTISTVKAVKEKGGKPLGVFAIDVSLKGLTDMINDVRIGENGYLLLIDNLGRLLADPRNPELNFSALVDLDTDGLGALNKVRNGEVELTIDGVPSVAQIHHSEKTGFTYAGIVSKAELAARTSAMKHLVMLLFLLAAAVSTAVAFLATRLFVKPIQGLVKILKNQAALDFRTDHSLTWLLDYKNDEIGEMITALANMKKEIVDFVQGIAKEAGLTGGSAENLSALSGETVASMEEVKSAVEQVASLSENNSAALQQTTAGIQEVSSGATSAAKASVDGAEATKQTARTSQEAGENVRALAKEIQHVGERSSRTMGIMEEVGQSVQAITGFVDTITQIADQTNLLALNAAIEAARAGEHGRGFAVVAEEVRKLAEQSNQAAGKVGDLIGILQTNTRTSIEAMGDVDRIVAEVVTSARSTTTRLDETLTQITKVNDAMQSIAAGSEEQAASSEEMAAGIDEVTKSTVEVTTHMDNIRQSTEETSLASEQVAKEAEILSEGVGRLKQLVAQFRFDAQETDA